MRRYHLLAVLVCLCACCVTVAWVGRYQLTVVPLTGQNVGFVLKLDRLTGRTSVAVYGDLVSRSDFAQFSDFH